MIKRVLSFKSRPKQPPRSAVDAPATEAAATPPAASGTTLEPAAVDAPAPAVKSGRGAAIRRNLSFTRSSARTPRAAQAAAEPQEKTASPSTAQKELIPGASSPAAGAAPTPPRALGQIKRTFSWQRGHRQARQAAASKFAALRGVGLERAAGALMLELPPEARAVLEQTCTALRNVAAALAARPTPPLHPSYAAHTHEGGLGGKGKENQDNYFVIHPSAELSIYAVLDGHGKRYGRLSSQVAAARMRVVLSGLHKWVLDAPEEAMRFAFAEAHTAIRNAILRADPTVRTVQGRDAGSSGTYLLHWIEEEDEPDGRWDAVDGGTTATLIALLRGQTAVIAMVGDSSALLVGRDPSSDAAIHRVLLEEHSPTCLPEYVRIRALPSGPQVRFVYDCPDFEEFPIFDTAADGTARLSDAGLKSADEHGCLHKNSRDDRFTLLAVRCSAARASPFLSAAPLRRRSSPAAPLVLLPSCCSSHLLLSPAPLLGSSPRLLSTPQIPETEVMLPKLEGLAGAKGAAQKTIVEEQAITMTRSLGDYYAHHHGVTFEPEVRSLPLQLIFDEGRYAAPHLYLGSDGVFDLWEFDEVSAFLVPPAKAGAADASGAELEALASSLIERTRDKGERFYGESADNLTGILVQLQPPPPPKAVSKAPPVPPRRSPPAPRSPPAALAQSPVASPVASSPVPVASSPVASSPVPVATSPVPVAPATIDVSDSSAAEVRAVPVTLVQPEPQDSSPLVSLKFARRSFGAASPAVTSSSPAGTPTGTPARAAVIPRPVLAQPLPGMAGMVGPPAESLPPPVAQPAPVDPSQVPYGAAPRLSPRTPGQGSPVGLVEDTKTPTELGGSGGVAAFVRRLEAQRSPRSG